MALIRKNFTNRQKAEIYVRDRALCCFSGVSLWLLDYGAAPSSVDWVDHITACAAGGDAEIENGACASSVYNWIKRQHKDGLYLYAKGRPTADFYFIYEVVPLQVATHLRRFENLHWSDWYFNRAVFHVLLAAGQRGQRRVDGKAFKRGVEYWANAALNCLNEWHRASEHVGTFKSRGLVAHRPTMDQKILLGLTEAKTKADIKKIISSVVPYVRSSERVMARLAEVENASEAKALLTDAKNDPYVVRRTREAIKLNIERLF